MKVATLNAFCYCTIKFTIMCILFYNAYSYAPFHTLMLHNKVLLSLRNSDSCCKPLSG